MANLTDVGLNPRPSIWGKIPMAFLPADLDLPARPLIEGHLRLDEALEVEGIRHAAPAPISQLSFG